MELKKLVLSDQFLSSRRKVVSGFSLGVAASLILLSLLLFIHYFKSSEVELLSQAFGGVANSNSPLVPSSSSDTDSNGGSKLQGPVTSLRTEDGDVQNPTHESVVFEKGVAFGKIQVGNSSSGTIKDISFLSEGVKEVTNNTIISNSVQENVNGDKNGGDPLKDLTFGDNSKVIENSNLGNVSYIVSPVAMVPVEEGNGAKDGPVNKTIPIAHYYESQSRKKGMGFDETCDIFDGKWVRDDSKPYYPAGSCPHIDRDFNCHINGRPDDRYVKWRWQPNGCDIPSLNATDFLERLRGKRLVFVGDSLNRNMWESLVCILRHSIKNKKRVYEISGKSQFKKKGFYAFRFEDYDCSVDFVAAPFLVRESTFTHRNGTIETLRLDLMDRTISMYNDADIIVFNTGHWWTHEKTSRGEDYYQEGTYVHPRLKALEAYKRALTTWARWTDGNIDRNRTLVFFRGYSVTHFRGGQWNSGGQCHKETGPIFNNTFLGKYPSKMRALEHVIQGMKTPVVYLNISRLTDFRKDGHPSIYRMRYETEADKLAAERSQDCSHWCLPGVPDTWNELLYASVLKAGKSSWKM